MVSQGRDPLGGWLLLLSRMRGKGFARIRGLLGFQDPVDQAQELAHNGDDDHFGGFASGPHLGHPESKIGITTHGHQSRHVEALAQLGIAQSVNAGFAAHRGAGDLLLDG